MADSVDDTLRALIRLIPPARALKDDLEKSIHLELYAGIGDLAVHSFQGLQSSVARITNDPYVASLTLRVAPSATDREKVSLVLLAAGQLLAYLEGQTGLVGALGGKGVNISIQKAPFVNSPNVKIYSEMLSKILTLQEKDEAQEVEHEGQQGQDTPPPTSVREPT